MPFFQQFETFDPVSEELYFSPFLLGDITRRARSMLGNRTKKQILAMAIRISKEIERYFEDAKYLEIERLRVQEGILESWGGDPEWPPDEDELDIPTWLNTSEVDVLRIIMESKYSNFFSKESEFKAEDFPEGNEVEMFAALSLWMVAEALEWKNSPLIAGECAVKAMDAVCRAEYLKDVEFLESYAKKVGAATYAENLERNKTERLTQLSIERHRKTTHAKNLVTDEWGKAPYKFASGEKAGSFFVDWLAEQGILNSSTGSPYEQRTVTSWIRGYAKEKGIRFR